MKAWKLAYERTKEDNDTSYDGFVKGWNSAMDFVSDLHTVRRESRGGNSRLMAALVWMLVGLLIMLSILSYQTDQIVKFGVFVSLILPASWFGAYLWGRGNHLDFAQTADFNKKWN